MSAVITVLTVSTDTHPCRNQKENAVLLYTEMVRGLENLLCNRNLERILKAIHSCTATRSISMSTRFCIRQRVGIISSMLQSSSTSRPYVLQSRVGTDNERALEPWRWHHYRNVGKWKYVCTCRGCLQRNLLTDIFKPPCNYRTYEKKKKSALH